MYTLVYCKSLLKELYRLLQSSSTIRAASAADCLLEEGGIQVDLHHLGWEEGILGGGAEEWECHMHTHTHIHTHTHTVYTYSSNPAQCTQEHSDTRQNCCTYLHFYKMGNTLLCDEEGEVNCTHDHLQAK